MTTVTVRTDQPNVTISKNVLGHFSEHLGRGIYDGIWVGAHSDIPNVDGIRIDAHNTFNDPDAVRIVELPQPILRSGAVLCKTPPKSVVSLMLGFAS